MFNIVTPPHPTAKHPEAKHQFKGIPLCVHSLLSVVIV